MKNIRIGFLGAGGIAQSHAYALDALKYYYDDAPPIVKAVVASPTPESRQDFAVRFGFEEALPPEKIFERNDLDALYILGPNQTHTPQLLSAARIPTIDRIYVEKPVASSERELTALQAFITGGHEKFILVGFQYLHKAPLRKALQHWHSGVFGTPIHFRAEYLHSSYLNPNYRELHTDRFQQIPANGAAVDLGTHVLSLLTAFLGDTLVVKSAASSGHFDDVPEESDLCTTVLLEEPRSGAIGTMIASRVSPGTGDHLSLELRGSRGALLFDTIQPDVYESYLSEQGWQRHEVLSEYLPLSKFPSGYTPSGWLRALVHNHYLFLGGNPVSSFIPDLVHGIIVQELIQQISRHLLGV